MSLWMPGRWPAPRNRHRAYPNGLGGHHVSCGWFGRQEAQGREVLSVEAVLERIHQLTADDMQRVARRLFRASGSQLAIVGPHKRGQAKQFQRVLSDELLPD